MKRITLAILSLAAVLAQAPGASAAKIEFRGFFTITALTQSCKPIYSVGDIMLSRYNPPNIGDNPGSTRLSYYVRFYAENYTLPKGKLTSKFKNVEGAGIARGFFTFPAKMRVTSAVPSRIKPSTKSVTLKGQIMNFDNLPNCTATFTASYTKYLKSCCPPS